VVLVAKSLAGTPAITFFEAAERNKGTTYSRKHCENIFTHQTSTEKPTAIKLFPFCAIEAITPKPDFLRPLGFSVFLLPKKSPH
jgi:hypothetical protein